MIACRVFVFFVYVIVIIIIIIIRAGQRLKILIVINRTIKKLISVNLTFNPKIFTSEVQQTMSRC